MMGSEFGKGQVEGVMGRITESLTNIADAFEHAVGPISKFVDALSPGSMQLFNLAVRDLNATIGTAFLPVVHVMTDAVQKAASLLVPAVDALAPAFQKLSEAFVSFMMPAVQVTSHALKGMAPLLEVVGTAFKTMGDVLAIFSVLMLSIKDALGEFLKGLIGGGEGGGIGDTLKKLRDGIYQVVMTLLVAAAQIAKAFGATGLITAIQKNLNELAKPGEGGKGGALSGATFKGFDQISKDLALAAAQAAEPGQEQDKKLEEFAKDAVKQLDDVLKNGQTLTQMLDDLWKQLMAKLDQKVDEIKETIKDKLKIW